MRISGVQKFTILDFPGLISCIAFIPGCNFRCGFCHNPEFVLPDQIKNLKEGFIPQEAFFNFLKERKGVIDGVVISGGEPTIMPDLPEFIKKIKKLGYMVKLDTNGTNPKMIKSLVAAKLIDYVAMDIKTDFDNYQDLVKGGIFKDKVNESISFLKAGLIPYEFRTTIIKEKHSKEILKKMAEILDGAKKLYLQTFRPAITLDETYATFNAFTEKEMEKIAKKIFSPHVDEVIIR